MKVPFSDLTFQEEQIRSEREQRFADIIAHNSYVLGPQVAEFESAFSEYTETKHTIGVSGGTHALTMIFRSLGLEEGDEVITIPTTFIASVTGIIYAGGKPVFVDVDPETRNFNFNLLEAAITSRTKAILPVHLYGLLADMDKVHAFAQKHNLFVVEDACQAHGATYKGKKAGSMSLAAAFSFYPGKNLGAYGDGGAVTTDDGGIADMVHALRNQGCVVKYDHEYLGYNGRLDALQAAVLIEKLKHLPEWNIQRRQIADRYLNELASLPIGLPKVLAETEPVWHLFVIELQGGRDAFMNTMADEEVSTGVHYPIPLHLTKALASLGYVEGDFPEAEKLSANCVSLPIYPGMTDEQVDYVIERVTAYFHEK
jgi:dTDP-4-amino-4,6-dideoxygalactose transaminase